jgi:hypothetical protein
MTATDLERRLTKVEQELARLQNERAPARRHPASALDQIHGIFENDQAFQEAARLGRKWRRAQRPAIRKKASGK